MDELARQPKHGPHYAQLLHLLNEMQNHQSAWPFQKPVSQDEVPDYYNVITEPMDLETMEKRLEEDAYSSPEEFIRDAKLIFNNCRRYNNESTSYWKNANKLEKFMNQKLKEIPEWSVSVSLAFRLVWVDRVIWLTKIGPWSIWLSEACLETEVGPVFFRQPGRFFLGSVILGDRRGFRLFLV